MPDRQRFTVDLGWRTATRMSSKLVLDAVEHAIWTRARDDVADLLG